MKRQSKRVMSILISVLLLFTSVPFAFALEKPGEPGWIEIFSFEDLYAVRYDLTANYKLMNDIDMTDWIAPGGDYDFNNQGWDPIGSDFVYADNAFSGVFEGNGHTISGMRMNVTKFPAGTGNKVFFGLFACVSGTVKNLTLVGSITVSGNKYNYAGGITAYLDETGSIQNCTNRVNLNVNGYYSQNVGGIAGFSYGDVQNCRNVATVYAYCSCNTYYAYAAGIVGCGASSGKPNSDPSNDECKTEINQCINTGDIKAKGNSSTRAVASGIVNFAKEVKNCYNLGTIQTDADSLSSPSFFSNGIAHRSSVSNCYNAGSVPVYKRNGLSYTTNNYAITIFPSTNCFYLKDSGISSTGAVAKSDAQLKKQIQFTGWDFDTVWTMDGRDDYFYPELRDVELLTPDDLKTPITGFVRISGAQEAGEVLTADISELVPEDATVTYTWTVDGARVSETDSYRLTEADIGKTLILSVTGTGDYKGTLTARLLLGAPHEHIAGEATVENEVPATCTEAGSYDEVFYCRACGEEISRDKKTTDPLGHAEKTSSTASSCDENGFTVTFCTRCGETLSSEVLPRLAHVWDNGVVSKNPTCTSQGVRTYTCLNCDASYTEPVDMLAHHWTGGTVTKEPSCTEAGEMTYTCTTGGETRSEPIDKLDHNIVLVPAVAPTCTKNGLTDGWRCSSCGKWFLKQQTIGKLAHTPGEAVRENDVEPSCETVGSYDTVIYCAVCGAELSRETVVTADALGHTDPDKNGNCQRCGAHIADVCPWCGGEHNGLLQGIISFFHSVLAKLFGAKY